MNERKPRTPLKRTITKSLSKSVRAFRSETGISQETLARKADVSTLTIGNIERGQITNLTLQTALSLSKATGKPLSQMLGIAA
jgi:DNA-binding XRE family transcriptional regulator